MRNFNDKKYRGISYFYTFLKKNFIIFSCKIMLLIK